MICSMKMIFIASKKALSRCVLGYLRIFYYGDANVAVKLLSY